MRRVWSMSRGFWNKTISADLFFFLHEFTGVMLICNDDVCFASINE